MIYRISRALLVGALAALPLLGAAQSDSPLAQLAKAGSDLHDQGRYQEADAKYQEALKLGPDNRFLRYLVALNYYQLQRYEESAALLRQYIDADPKAAPMLAYQGLGVALNALKKPDDAVKAYERGLKYYPEANMLYFNLGNAYLKLNKQEDAAEAYRHSARLAPLHPTSALFLGVVTDDGGNRVPALLEMARFLVLAPEHRLALPTLRRVYKIVGSGVQKTGENQINITMSPHVLKDVERGRGEDNFGDQDMLLTLMTASDHIEENRNKTPAVRFAEKLNDLFKNLGTQDGRQRRKGFAWEFYAPYFVELQRQGHAEACAYLLRSADPADEETKAWLAAHPSLVEDFRAWSAAYQWPK